MKHALHIGKEPNFQLVLIASAVIHLLLITVIVIPLKTREKEYKSYFVNLVGPVNTPLEAEDHALANGSKAGEISRPLPKADMALESAEKVSKEIERIRAISALSKLKKKDAEISHKIEILRQKIQEGFSKSSGSPNAAQSVGYDSYYAMITRKIWSEWIYPESVSAGLEVIIAITIDRNGKIISHAIEKSSGNALFDRSAIKAILKASPLPSPSVETEIGVRFYL